MPKPLTYGSQNDEHVAAIHQKHVADRRRFYGTSFFWNVWFHLFKSQKIFSGSGKAAEYIEVVPIPTFVQDQYCTYYDTTRARRGVLAGQNLFGK